MSVTAERVPNEPIVIFTYDGLLDAALFKEVLAMNARFVEEVGGPIYIIADVRKMTTTFMDMVKAMQATQQQGAGAATDENIRQLMFVGSAPLVTMFKDNLARQHVPMEIAMFPTVEEALEATRIQVKLHQKSAVSVEVKSDSPVGKQV